MLTFLYIAIHFKIFSSHRRTRAKKLKVKIIKLFLRDSKSCNTEQTNVQAFFVWKLVMSLLSLTPRVSKILSQIKNGSCQKDAACSSPFQIAFTSPKRSTQKLLEVLLEIVQKQSLVAVYTEFWVSIC